MTTRCAVIAGGTDDERERRRLKMLDEGCEVVMLARDMAEAANASVTLRNLLPGACVDVVALDRATARFNRRHDFSARLGGRAATARGPRGGLVRLVRTGPPLLRRG